MSGSPADALRTHAATPERVRVLGEAGALSPRALAAALAATGARPSAGEMRAWLRGALVGLGVALLGCGCALALTQGGDALGFGGRTLAIGAITAALVGAALRQGLRSPGAHMALLALPFLPPFFVFGVAGARFPPALDPAVALLGCAAAAVPVALATRAPLLLTPAVCLLAAAVASMAREPLTGDVGPRPIALAFLGVPALCGLAWEAPPGRSRELPRFLLGIAHVAGVLGALEELAPLYGGSRGPAGAAAPLVAFACGALSLVTIWLHRRRRPDLILVGMGGLSLSILTVTLVARIASRATDEVRLLVMGIAIAGAATLLVAGLAQVASDPTFANEGMALRLRAIAGGRGASPQVPMQTADAAPEVPGGAPAPSPAPVPGGDADTSRDPPAPATLFDLFERLASLRLVPALESEEARPLLIRAACALTDNPVATAPSALRTLFTAAIWGAALLVAAALRSREERVLLGAVGLAAAVVASRGGRSAARQAVAIGGSVLFAGGAVALVTVRYAHPQRDAALFALAALGLAVLVREASVRMVASATGIAVGAVAASWTGIADLGRVTGFACVGAVLLAALEAPLAVTPLAGLARSAQRGACLALAAAPLAIVGTPRWHGPPPGFSTEAIGLILGSAGLLAFVARSEARLPLLGTGLRHRLAALLGALVCGALVTLPWPFAMPALLAAALSAWRGDLPLARVAVYAIVAHIVVALGYALDVRQLQGVNPGRDIAWLGAGGAAIAAGLLLREAGRAVEDGPRERRWLVAFLAASVLVGAVPVVHGLRLEASEVLRLPARPIGVPARAHELDLYRDLWLPAPGRHATVVLRVGADGLARFARPDSGEPLAPDERRLRLTWPRGDRWEGIEQATFGRRLSLEDFAPGPVTALAIIVDAEGCPYVPPRAKESRP